MKKIPLLFLALSILLAMIRTAESSPDKMAVDLSNDQVEINTGFNGIDVMLFGTTNGADDIIVTVTGSPETNMVRKKTQIAGIWVNTENVMLDGAPNFYAIASTRPLDQIAAPRILKLNQIGVQNLAIVLSQNSKKPTNEALTKYKHALVRLKSELGLFVINPTNVKLIDDQLFKTNIYFPANMSTGNYIAEVFSFKNGELVEKTNKPILVEKVGIGAEVFNLAHNQSALYGIIAILIAVGSGWIAAVVFRKV
jgi:uncharacterized protein (TIGR02186 family)